MLASLCKRCFLNFNQFVPECNSLFSFIRQWRIRRIIFALAWMCIYIFRRIIMNIVWSRIFVTYSAIINLFMLNLCALIFRSCFHLEWKKSDLIVSTVEADCLIRTRLCCYLPHMCRQYSLIVENSRVFWREYVLSFGSTKLCLVSCFLELIVAGSNLNLREHTLI